jgi:hypothetical protein
MVTFWARVAGQDGAYLWYAPCPVPAPRYAKRDRTDKCGTLSRYVPASDRSDDVGQVWDIVPLCPVKRLCDATGQVGDVVPACPAKATSPGGFGVSSLPLLHCDLAPGTHRPVQRTQPTGIQANAEGPYTASASMPPSGLQDLADVLSDVLKAAAGTPWSSRSP